MSEIIIPQKINDYSIPHQMKIFNLNKFKAILLMAVFFGVLRFYLYNNIENTHGQAKLLKMNGLTDFICKDAKQNTSDLIDDCDGKSIYTDTDWGVTAYYSIYGIKTKGEANEIVNFMETTRRKNKQDNIPIEISIYSIPRSQSSSHPQEYKILSKRF